MPYKFWMVFNPNGKSPRFQHESPESAHEEALRLARVNPGERFCVLESQYECVTTAPTVDTLMHSMAPQLAGTTV